MSTLIWVVVAASALSLFFSVASYSLREYRRVELEESFNGAAGRRRLAVLARHLVPLRLTVSFCRAVANLVLVVAMVFLVSGDVRPVRALAAAVAAGAIIAVAGIAIPHAWAAHAGERFLSATLGVLLAFRYALYPLVWVMQAFDLPVRRLSGRADGEELTGESAKQEILQAAEEGQAEGAVDAEEVEMIESVMEFADTHAAEIMTPRTDIFALPVDLPVLEARERVVEAGHTRVPVYREDLDHIIGILYAKDLLRHLDGDGPTDLVGVMRQAFFVPESKPLDDLLREFKLRKLHLAIVLDEYGGTAGLVTIEDVLEEIVGEISDEYDRAEPTLLTRVDDRTAEVEGRLYIDDLNDALDLEIPEDEDYDTVAGLVFSELGYVPEIGEELTTGGAKFTVLAADERKIQRLRVEVLRRQEAREEE